MTQQRCPKCYPRICECRELEQCTHDRDTRIELYCDCGWSGSPEELVSKTDDETDRDFNRCPWCGGLDEDMEPEEVDEE